MNTYYLSQWRSGEETYLTIDAENINDLYNKLKEKYNKEKINLNGYNYEYITNAAHYMAAGYISTMDVVTIAMAKSPAHFNSEFFYVIGYLQF